MNNYETVFILTPVLSDAQMKEAVEKIKNVLTSQKAEIVNEENWGLRKLAYPISKKTTGFYQLIEFKAEPTVVDVLETQFRRDERVLRFLTFRQDKFAAEYAIKRRNLKIVPPPEPTRREHHKIVKDVLPIEEIEVDIELDTENKEV
jgi:small subunit ribosomal protein S6